ncbi:5,10-methylenetetrahydromethanopterin reductase [Methanosarcina horonobensis HB-1 = JCM 15518]|uniref:5,10-methylenetetrahydromethanopterin reductase n=1 Tax=Methanosarcina horonobensis HB-1 = JCM 15518 TaxID=1434110 RepID=A0A0E3SDV4_9EURY|nr:TIGR03885 family FMN-dependent LLM class oxidoreductase [Methanosarcina horonobensis]AKB78307.1 5,10-methylenetetrahydromethanopterin reductase [Methanosarcina horonobensis HB-1 = JCM 15518]
MVGFSYHVSHEQFRPGELLNWVQLAEKAGFTGALSSDHFKPWSSKQAEQGGNGFAWSWLGAAMQATSLEFGVVNAPGQRYHPAIIAQAAATLAEMFPGRFWMALGSGQALNERITGDLYPSKFERNERLQECVEVIRSLFAGDTVTYYGTHITVEEAKLYVQPGVTPKIIGAALTPETAKWIGGWADGMVTVSQPYEKLRKMVDAFHAGGGEGKPMYLQVHLSYSNTDEKARQGAYEQWKNNTIESIVEEEIYTPEQFDAAAKYIRPDDLDEHIRISSEPENHIEWIQKDIELGFSNIILHNANLEQERFIEDFGEKVLPVIKKEFN